MDTLSSKIEKNQKIVSKYLLELALEQNNALGNTFCHQAVIDKENNHFLLVNMGWHKQTFIYSVSLHLDIHPETGNIWIQQNNTEILVVSELEALGISKKHFVLGFRSEAMRAHSEYATS